MVAEIEAAITALTARGDLGVLLSSSTSVSPWSPRSATTFWRPVG